MSVKWLLRTDFPAGNGTAATAHTEARIQAVIPWRRKRTRPRPLPAA